MLPKDRQTIAKLRRRNSYLFIIIFFLAYWLIQKYNDIEYMNYEHQDIMNELFQKEKEITSLKLEISNSKKIQLKEPEKRKKIIKREEPKKLIDTIPVQEQSKEAPAEIIETITDTIN